MKIGKGWPTSVQALIRQRSGITSVEAAGIWDAVLNGLGSTDGERVRMAFDPVGGVAVRYVAPADG